VPPLPDPGAFFWIAFGQTVALTPIRKCVRVLPMPKPVHITTPWPTPAEIDRRFPIPKARRKELQALVDEFKAVIGASVAAPKSSIKPEKRRKRASAA